MSEESHVLSTMQSGIGTLREPYSLPPIEFVRVGGASPLVPKRLPNVTLPLPSEGLAYAVAGLGNEMPISKTLAYDFGTLRIDGNSLTLCPTVDGEHSIEVALETCSGKCFMAKILLTVNPDPKTLWKDIPVADGTKFFKPDTATVSCWIPDDKPFAKLVAASRRGRSHANQGTCRDDDMSFDASGDCGCILLAVADGAGSARYSREGSRRAVEAAISFLRDNLSGESWVEAPEGGTYEVQIGNQLVAAARHAYETLQTLARTEATLDPAVTLRDFHTTLLLAAIRHDGNDAFRVVSFSVGDGAIAWYKPGSVKLLCSPDSGEFSGQTKFLTMSSIWNEAEKDLEAFRRSRCFSLQIPSGSGGCLFLMTDGITDPFFETEASLSNPAVWDAFASEQLVKAGGVKAPFAEDAAGKLLAWLQFWVPGNHDDRTIAMFFPCKGGFSTDTDGMAGSVLPLTWANPVPEATGNPATSQPDDGMTEDAFHAS